MVGDSNVSWKAKQEHDLLQQEMLVNWLVTVDMEKR
jgi:hypothetical protein